MYVLLEFDWIEFDNKFTEDKTLPKLQNPGPTGVHSNHTQAQS